MAKIVYKQTSEGAGRTWQLQEAKACFSEVVRRAQQSPQHVTVRGQEAVVVVSARDYERLQPDGRRGLVELMAESPLSEIEFGERGGVMPVREIDL